MGGLVVVAEEVDLLTSGAGFGDGRADLLGLSEMQRRLSHPDDEGLDVGVVAGFADESDEFAEGHVLAGAEEPGEGVGLLGEFAAEVDEADADGGTGLACGLVGFVFLGISVVLECGFLGGFVGAELRGEEERGGEEESGEGGK